MNHRKIRFSSLLAAVLLFLFPWFDVSCGDRTLVTQTGFQAMVGSGSANEELEGGLLKGAKVERSADEKGVAASWMTLLAFLAILGGVGCHLSRRLGKQELEHHAPKLALAAVAFLLLQWITGFPIQDEVADSVAKRKASGGDEKLLEMMEWKDPEAHTRIWFLLTLVATLGGASAQVVSAATKLRRKIEEKRGSGGPPAS